MTIHHTDFSVLSVKLVSKFSTVVDDMQSSSFKQGQELVGNASSELDYVKESDIDAAKVAAMKAAELGMLLGFYWQLSC